MNGGHNNMNGANNYKHSHSKTAFEINLPVIDQSPKSMIRKMPLSNINTNFITPASLANQQQ